MTVQQDLEDDDDAPLLYQPSTGSGKKSGSSGLKGVKPIKPSATAKASGKRAKIKAPSPKVSVTKAPNLVRVPGAKGPRRRNLNCLQRKLQNLKALSSANVGVVDELRLLPI